MTRMTRAVCLLLLVAGWCSAALAAERLDLPPQIRLGALHVAKPMGEPQGFVFLLSDKDGWNDRLDRTVDALAAAGYAAAGIDLPTWTAAMAADPGDTDCHYVVGDLEDAGKFVQRAWELQQYRHPVVAGIGEGGTVAMLALANAPPETITGAVSLDGTKSVHTNLTICPPGAGVAAGDGAFSYGRPPDLKGWLLDAYWQAAQPTFTWPQDLPTARSLDLRDQHDLPAAMVAALAASRDLGQQDGEGGRSLADLPLVELPVAHPSQTFAIVLSGDGGWRDLDKSLAGVFEQEGLPTVGLDSLRYFWTERQPAQIAADIERIVRYYRHRWGTDRVALVGYSFGADVLPAVWPLLSEATQQSVIQVSLLALGVAADFEFHVTGWIGWKGEDARPIPPDLVHMDSKRVQCFFGSDEGPDETGCRSPEATGFERIERPGGHHFDGNYAAIAQAILAGLARRGGGTW